MTHANDMKAIATRVRLEKEKRQQEEKINLEQEKVKTRLDKLAKRAGGIEEVIRYRASLGETSVFIGSRNGDDELNLPEYFEKAGYRFKNAVEYGDHISGDADGYNIYWG